MSVGRNPDGGWDADCIFCHAQLGTRDSYEKAERINDRHLLSCPELSADDRRAALSPGPGEERY